MVLVLKEHNAISFFHLDRPVDIAWTALLERQISPLAVLIFLTIRRKHNTFGSCFYIMPSLISSYIKIIITRKFVWLDCLTVDNLICYND